MCAGLGNFVRCFEKKVENMCSDSDRGAWAKIVGLCGRVAWTEDNYYDF